MQRSGDDAFLLTLFEPADVSTMAEGDRDADLRKWFEFPSDFEPSTRHSREVISRWEAERAAGVRLPFAVRNASTGELVGGCELRPEGNGVGGISYWTYPRHRNKGVATAALRLLSRHAFEQCNMRRVELMIDPENTASRRVAVAGGFAQVGARGGKLIYGLDRVPPN